MLKARENPFSTDRVLQVRYQLLDRSWEELLQDLSRLDFRAAIVGPEGSGKTTLLEDLEPRLKSLGFFSKFLRFTRESPKPDSRLIDDTFQGLGKNNLLLIDGAEQLNVFTWMRIKQQAKQIGGLIITLHHAGRLPTLIECRTDVELFRDVLADLLGEDLSPIEASIESIFRESQGNIRDALRTYYDIFAENKLVHLQ